MEWTQRLLGVGEAFSGAPCTSLRTLLERQSCKFFRLYHHANIEVGLVAVLVCGSGGGGVCRCSGGAGGVCVLCAVLWCEGAAGRCVELRSLAAAM